MKVRAITKQRKATHEGPEQKYPFSLKMPFNLFLSLVNSLDIQCSMHTSCNIKNKERIEANQNQITVNVREFKCPYIHLEAAVFPSSYSHM